MKPRKAKPGTLTRKRKNQTSADERKVTARLLGDVRTLIEQSRSFVASSVNSTLVMLNWHIGKRIRDEILKGKRAGYGEQIIKTLAEHLTAEYGRGYSEQTLRHMIRFAEAFPDETILSAARRELGWAHFRSLIYLDDPLKREFYAEMCRIERWSTRTLEKKIGGMIVEIIAAPE